MKFANQLMSDQQVQFEKIGTLATRSSRNKWAETVEPIVRQASPFPISYDVTVFSKNMSNLNFSEFAYTELLGGLWVHPQCMDITCRMIQDASRVPSEPLEQEVIEQILSDKYDLNQDLGKWSSVKKVVFMPGHNLLPIASQELIGRIMFEQDDVYIKPHPITHDEIIKRFGEQFGWNKIIDKTISGDKLLKQCEVVYATSCSEMTISGALMGKPVINVSNFTFEGYGVYLPFSRLIWKMQPELGIRATQEMIHRVLRCSWSGVYFPFTNDIESKVEEYFRTALEYRERFKPLQPPWNPKDGPGKPPVQEGNFKRPPAAAPANPTPNFGKPVPSV